MEASLSRLLFLTVSYARWLPLEHESALSFPLCSYRKTLIPKKWNTQKHLPLHLWCAHLSCKKKNPTPLQTQCSESTELWYKNSLIHVLLQWRTAHFTRYLPLCLEDWKKKKKDRKGGHPPLCSPINPMLPEGDSRRQKPVTSCVSQDSFIFPSPYVLITELSPDSICLWRLKIISHQRQTDKMHHFPLHHWSL